MKWIKRYWFNILLYLGFFVIIFWLLPAQQRHYLPEDLRTVTRIGWRMTWIIATALFMLLLILVIVKKAFGWGIINALFFIAGIALFFHPAFETATLFLNRQFHTQPHQRRFVVSSMVGDTATNDLFLYDLQLHRDRFFFDNALLLPAAHLEHWRLGDTVNIPFYPGLFGVPWFQRR